MKSSSPAASGVKPLSVVVGFVGEGVAATDNTLGVVVSMTSPAESAKDPVAPGSTRVVIAGVVGVVEWRRMWEPEGRTRESTLL